jgi:hypothetical protein
VTYEKTAQILPVQSVETGLLRAGQVARIREANMERGESSSTRASNGRQQHRVFQWKAAAQGLPMEGSSTRASGDRAYCQLGVSIEAMKHALKRAVEKAARLDGRLDGP